MIANYTVISFPGATTTDAMAISNAGVIVGTYTLSDPNTVHGFIRDVAGNYSTLDLPGATRTVLDGINDAIDVVGHAVGGTYNGQAFVRNLGGSVTQNSPPGANANSVDARGINDSGQIIGSYGQGNAEFGFLRSTAGSYTSISVPGSIGTVSYGINNAGDVVGNFETSGGASGGEGFLRYSSGGFTVLDYPGANYTQAYSINDLGEIVGSSGFGFFRDAGGHFSTLSISGVTQTIPLAINDSDQIVGRFVAGASQYTFLADLPSPSAPVPEPNSFFLCLVGLSAMVVWASLRRG